MKTKRENDLIDPIVGKREPVFKINHFKLMEMAGEKSTLYSPRESCKNHLASRMLIMRSDQSHTFSSDSEAKQFTFRTWKEAMDFFRTSGSRLAEGIKISD